MFKPSQPKRFIAGAVCPRCAAMDKLVMFQDEDNRQIRECVSCGYSDEMTDTGPKELTTRVNQPRLGEKPLSHEDEIQVVELLDSKKHNKPE